MGAIYGIWHMRAYEIPTPPLNLERNGWVWCQHACFLFAWLALVKMAKAVLLGRSTEHVE